MPGYPDWQRPEDLPYRINTIYVQIHPLGINYAQVVPAAERWRPRFVKCQLSTSAAVANRRVRLQMIIGGNVVGDWPFDAVQGAGNLWQYQWAVGAGNYREDASGVNRTYPIPSALWPEGSTLQITVDSIQVNDRLQIIGIEYESVPIA